MCGIVAYSGRSPADQTKIRWLMIENERRGEHSTGIFSQREDKETPQLLYKELGKSSIIVDDALFKKAIKGATTLVAHTRKASWGAIKKENAHPFDYAYKERIVGVHNGFVVEEMLDAYAKKWEFSGKDAFDVDSMIIFAALAKSGGDYKILSEIDGALTLAWMMPDKYPDHLFLYKRARELHYGITPEGTYVSSEAKPLSLIGVNGLWEVPDDTVMVLKDGILLDMVDIAPPKLHSLKIGVGRSEWKREVSKAELYSLLPEEEKKFKPIHSVSKRPKYFESENSNYNSGAVDPTIIDDGMLMLINDIEEEIKNLGVTTLTYERTRSHTENDSNCCLVVIKLIDSIHKEGLPGYVLWDDQRKDIHGATGFNGVAVLKFESTECVDGDIQAKGRTLRIYSPIDMDTGSGEMKPGTKSFAFKINPKMSRIMEVVLSIPFPQSDDKTSSNSSPTKAEIASTRRDAATFGGLSKSLVDLHTVGDGKGQVLEAVNRLNTERVREEEGSLQAQHSGKEIHGQEETGANNGGKEDDSRSNGRRTTEESGISMSNIVGAKSTHLPRVILPGMISAALSIKNSWSQSEKIKVMSAPDFRRVAVGWMGTTVASHYDLKLLCSDAVLIKLWHHQLSKGVSWSIPYYAKVLLLFSPSDYIIKFVSPEKREEILLWLDAEIPTMIKTPEGGTDAVCDIPKAKIIKIEKNMNLIG